MRISNKKQTVRAVYHQKKQLVTVFTNRDQNG